MKEKTPILINGHPHLPYKSENCSQEEMVRRSQNFYEFMDRRRSVRQFSNREVPKKVIDNLIQAASTAPSGAHKQLWTFCAVSSPELKTQIRIAAEKEEKENYESRMSDRWKKDLVAFDTDMNKPFLEIAPWLIVAFKRVYEYGEKEDKLNNYYVNESMGIACGMLIAAIHHAGLVTLTHTPSPMKFLAEILKRPDNERAFLLLPVGYPAESALVPDLRRKSLEEVGIYYT